MRKSVLLAFLAFVSAVSCKKNEETIYAPPAPDFIHLKVGNYWVYAFSKIDTNGVETQLEETDSSYILKDTVVNGLKYFVKIEDPYRFSKSSYPSYRLLLRDSSGYLVDNYGNILFAQNNFSDTLAIDSSNIITWNYLKMIGKDSVVTVPAGSFVTRTSCRNWYPLEPGYPWGIRKSYNVYGKDAGLLKYNYWFYYSGISYEAKLLRYRQ